MDQVGPVDIHVDFTNSSCNYITTYGGRIHELLKWMTSERAGFQWRIKKDSVPQ